MTALPRIFFLSLAAAAVVCIFCLRAAETQSSLRRITNTNPEGINSNPSVSGDGRIVGFESTEDVAGAGGTDHFRAIRANISVDPATFFQMGGTRAVAPGISQDGSRIAFASKDDPLGTNVDGNSEIFLFNGSNLIQVTNTTPGSPATRVTDGNFQPSISDDGRYIAFSSNRNLATQNSDGNLEIFVYDAVAASFTQLTNSTGIVGYSDAKISGDGLTIASARDPQAAAGTTRDLVRINRTNGALTVLAANVTRLALTYGRAISDDGTRIAYSAETATNTTQVFFYDGRSGNVSRQVTTLGARATEIPLHPTISGDGRRLAFATRRAVTGFTNSDASVELYTYDIPTGTFARITNTSAGDADCFDGSSPVCEIVSSLNDDGSTVVFNFPRVLSGAVTGGLENKSEIYATGVAARPPSGTLTSILNQASLGHEPSPIKAVAPNSIAAAFGAALSNTTQQSQKQPNGDFPTNVGGTTVTVNGRSAQIFFVSPGRVHFLVPAQTEIGNAEVVITNADGFASRGTVPVLLAAPGIFTRSGDGVGEGMILNADTLAEGPFDPSNGNLRLIIFSTGVRNGVVTTVNIGGRVVTPEAVNPSTEMPGLDEVKVRVPTDLRGAGIVNLSIQSDGRDSNPVTVTFTGDPSRNIVINEVLADPPDGIAGDANHDGVRDGTQDEFIELVNGTSSETISLSGWTVRTRAIGSSTETTRFTFAAGTSLPGGEAIVVFGGGNFNPADPIFGCAQVVKATTTAGLSLTNSGLTIIVRDASGNEITQFSYGGSTSLAGDNNQSLTRSPDVTGAFVQHTAAAGANGRRFSPGIRTNGTPFGNCPSILTSVVLSPPSATITVGQAQEFSAQAFDQFGRVMTGVTINFSSDNTAVATVESVTMNSSTGVAAANVQSRNPGIAHIVATATDGVNTVNSNEATLTVSGPLLSINDVSLNEGHEGPTTFTFTVSLSTPAPTAVTFDITTQDNTATVADNDYVARSLTSQTIPAGQQTYTFEVMVNGDGNLEPTETFLVNVTNVSGAGVSDTQGLGTIITDDVPVLSVGDVSAAETNSGTTTFTFTVSSSLPAPTGGITFDIATQDNTATVANNDYVGRSLTGQSIPAGQMSYTFDVNVNGDTAVEPDETFFVNISNVSANAAIADGQGIGTIQNDDVANLVISQVYGGGNNTGAPFRNDFVEIYNRGTATVDFALTPYSIQYAGVGSNFSSGNQTNLTSGSIAPGKYFLVQQAGGTTNGAPLPTPDATGSIAMGNTAGKVALVIGIATLPSATCPGDDAVTPFNPSSATIADFVGYGNSATTAGHCYEGAAPAPAPSNTTADFRKAGGCVDTNENGADFFTASPNPRNSSSPAGTCQPEITINDVTVTEGNSGSVNATFTVSLSAASTQTVTVNFATADGTATLLGNDYQTNSGTLTFVPGDTSESITVLVNGDTLDEANETFFVNLSAATNAVLLDSQGQGTITDNDPAPSLSINDVSMAEGNEGTTTFTFTVSLSAASGQTVTVNFATADNSATQPGDYQSTSGQLTFVPGDISETITVLVNGDGTLESGETFFVDLTTPTNATLSDAQGQGTIIDDDAPPVVADLALSKSDSPDPVFPTQALIYTLTLTNNGPDTAQSVVVTDSLPSEVTFVDCNSDQGGVCGGTATTPTVTFASLASGVTATVTLEVTVNANVTAGTVITNNASVASSTSDSNGSNNAAQATTTVQEVSAGQLLISEFRTRGPAGASDEFVEVYNPTTATLVIGGLKIRVSNDTGTISDRVTISAGATLDPGCHYLIANSTVSTGYSGATAPNQTYTTGITDTGGIAITRSNGTTVIDQVGMSAGSAYKEGTPLAALTNNVEQSYERKPGGSFGNGTDTNNNSADFLLNAGSSNPQNSSSGCLNTSSADLSISKTDTPDPVTIGSNITYTLTILNNGAATAQDVLVTDALPAETTFVSCNATGGAVCGGAGNNRTATLSALASGASFTVTLIATANGPHGTTATNNATVSSATPDANSSNDAAMATTLMQEPTPSLSIDDVTATEGTGGTTNFVFTVTLTPSSSQTVTVNYATSAASPATAAAATDYTPTSGMLTFTPGDTSEQITVQVNGDTANEAICETFFVILTSPVNATISDDTGQGSITDDDGTKLVISQIYGGGGNSGATYTHDFIELFNRGDSPISLNGFSVQYAPATGTTGSYTVITLPNVTLQAGRYYLIQGASASGTGSPLPTPDLVPVTLTDLAATAGRVALVNNTTALSRASCPTGSTIIDFVGYGTTAICREGASTADNAPAPSNTTSALRKLGGCQDTGNNNADFTTPAPTPNPRNTLSAANTCSCSTSYSSFFSLGNDWLKGSLARLTVGGDQHSLSP